MTRRHARPIIPPAAALLLLAGITLVLAGCAVMGMPSREGSTSDDVVWAYFSKERAGATFVVDSGPTRAGIRSSYSETVQKVSLPPRATEFDPARDAVVYFFTMVKGPKQLARESLEVRIDLVNPIGQRFEFNQTGKVENRAALGERPQEYAERTRYWFTWAFNTKPMKEHPGVWVLHMTLDGQPVGAYSFMLGDAAAIAGIKEAQKRSAQIAADFARGPEVRLDLKGPPGAKVRVTQTGHTVKSGAFDATGNLAFTLAPGAYELEVTGAGFQPSNETVLLREQDQQVSRTFTLRPR